MSDAPETLLLAVGDELLNGEIRDRNLYTLIRNLTHLGFAVQQVAMVRDDDERIVALLARWLAAHPDLVVVSGGLGPTEDDATLRALGHALGRPLVEDPAARSLVEEQYERLRREGYVRRRGPERARRKMATLPKGARPLQNPIGTAPGVRVEHEGTLIYVLPGVPAELEAIYAESVEPELRRRFKTGVWIEGHVVAQCSDEAQVADVLREVAPRHPEVYVKSLARPFPDAEKSGLRILAAARADRPATAREEIEEALTDLAHTLERADIPVLERHVKAQTDREGGNDGSGTQSRHH